MNYDILKKIPIFKNFDFTEAKDRKSAFMIIAIVLGLILIIVANIAKPKKNSSSEAEEARIEEFKSSLPEIPMGEDNEILDSEDAITTHERAKRNVAGNMMAMFFDTDSTASDSNEEENILDAMNREDPYSSSSGDKARLSARERANKMFHVNEIFGLENENADGTPRTDVFGQSEYEHDPATLAKEGKEKMRAQVTEITTTISDPNTPEEYARRTRGGGYTEPEPEPELEEQTYTDPSEEEPEPEPVKIRKTGTLSGFDDEWGSLSKGVKGLDDRTQFITADDIKPVKAAFIKEEKLQSGQRVTIRLLEDMYADGIIIQKNSHLSAICNIGTRLTLTVSRVELNGVIHDINFVAVDNDGNEGLYCPQTQGQEVSKQVKDDAQSIAGQALRSSLGSAGSAITNIVTSGTKIVSTVTGKQVATVSSGYTFYLVQKQN